MNKTNDLSSYQKLFITTASEYIQKMKKSVSLLLKDSANKDAIEKIHIAAHSLKSQSEVMSYIQMGTACLKIEHIFQDIQEEKLPVTKNLLVLLKETIEKLEESLNEIKKNNTERDLTFLIKKLEEI